MIVIVISKQDNGRFISSRIHPFPSEHGSKDAQSLLSTIMFTQMGTSGNLPFIYSLLFALPAFPCFCFLWRLLYIFFHPGIPSFFLSAAVYFFSFSLITCAVSWCSWLSHHFHVVRVPGSNPGGTTFQLSGDLLLFWIISDDHSLCLQGFVAQRQSKGLQFPGSPVQFRSGPSFFLSYTLVFLTLYFTL